MRANNRILAADEGSAMADNRQAIKAAYDSGLAEVFMIVGSLDATRKQRATARQTARDLSSMLVAHTLQTIEGRTALLAGLIVELHQVIESIEASPPLKESVDNVTALLEEAQELFKDEKEAMI
jgi:hypothetical protein